MDALRNASFFKPLVGLLLVCLLGGCASTRNWTAGEARAAGHALDPGDRVVVVLKTGERIETRLETVGQSRVETEAGDYPWTDINTLEARKSNTGGVLILLGVVGGVFFISRANDCNFFPFDCSDDD
ncbi:hypothetical protein GYB61_02630 [bacterium]|nr:hypothetical protein [bacterium]